MIARLLVIFIRLQWFFYVDRGVKRSNWFLSLHDAWSHKIRVKEC
jgi:hypothetical protein